MMQKWDKPTVRHQMKGQTDTGVQKNASWQSKGISFWYTQKHGWNSKNYEEQDDPGKTIICYIIPSK